MYKKSLFVQQTFIYLFFCCPLSVCTTLCGPSRHLFAELDKFDFYRQHFSSHYFLFFEMEPYCSSWKIGLVKVIQLFCFSSLSQHLKKWNPSIHIIYTSWFKLSLVFETFPEKYKKKLVTHFWHTSHHTNLKVTFTNYPRNNQLLPEPKG